MRRASPRQHVTQKVFILFFTTLQSNSLTCKAKIMCSKRNRDIRPKARENFDIVIKTQKGGIKKRTFQMGLKGWVGVQQAEIEGRPGRGSQRERTA